MRRALICVILAMIAVSPGDESGKVRVTRALDRVLPVELNISGASFSASLDRLVSLTHVKLNVQWEALKGAGVTRDSPVFARLRDVKASKALSTILCDVGGGDVRVTYFVKQDGTILITTWDDFVRTHTLTKAYYVKDLIEDVNAMKRAANVQQLIEALDIGPEHGWRESDEAGRKAGYGAREKEGMLIVRESAILHERIPRGLRALREEREKTKWYRRLFKN